MSRSYENDPRARLDAVRTTATARAARAKAAYIRTRWTWDKVCRSHAAEVATNLNDSDIADLCEMTPKQVLAWLLNRGVEVLP